MGVIFLRGIPEEVVGELSGIGGNFEAKAGYASRNVMQTSSGDYPLVRILYSPGGDGECEIGRLLYRKGENFSLLILNDWMAPYPVPYSALTELKEYLGEHFSKREMSEGDYRESLRRATGDFAVNRRREIIGRLAHMPQFVLRGYLAGECDTPESEMVQSIIGERPGNIQRLYVRQALALQKESAVS